MKFWFHLVSQLSASLEKKFDSIFINSLQIFILHQMISEEKYPLSKKSFSKTSFFCLVLWSAAASICPIRVILLEPNWSWFSQVFSLRFRVLNLSPQNCLSSFVASSERREFSVSLRLTNRMTSVEKPVTLPTFARSGRPGPPARSNGARPSSARLTGADADAGVVRNFFFNRRRSEKKSRAVCHRATAEEDVRGPSCELSVIIKNLLGQNEPGLN